MGEILSRLPETGRPKKVVVIGGGVSGPLSGYELQKAGHQVTLLEARSWGNGSSSRSAACIRAQFAMLCTILGMVYSEDYYQRWTETVGGILSPITQNGYLFLFDYSVDAENIRARVEMQRGAGLAGVQFLDKAALADLYPYLEITDIQCATLCLTDGFLDPSKVYTDAVEAARREGATAVQNAEVVDVVFDGSGTPTAVRTADGRTFEGDVFVNATGVWAPRVSKLFQGATLDIEARRRYLYFLSGFNGHAGDFMTYEDFARMPMTITPRGCYARPESAKGSQLMMGWLQYANPVCPEFDNQDVIEEGFGREEYGAALRKEMGTYLPDIEHMGGIAHATSGFYEDTPDHNPLIGYDPVVPNLIHAAGFSGHGLMHAPFTAAIVVHLVEAERNLPLVCLPGVGEVDISTFAVGREYKSSEGMVI